LKVLVTGASGFVGRHVSDYLTSNGVETLGTDVVGTVNHGNITDPHFVFDVLGKLDFDAILHLAAVADLKKTQEDPFGCFTVNCFGTLNLLELARRKSVSRFIYASSANVYGAPKRVPVTEDSPVQPRLPYDYSKVAAENFVLGYFFDKGLPVTITRSWLLFGENDLPNRAVPRFVKSCLAGEPIGLFNGGRDTTAPTHARNYGRLVQRILNTKDSTGQVFNFGGERKVSIRELAELIKKLTSSRSELRALPPRSEAESEPQVSYPDIDKIRSVLGYEPELNLEEGLTRTIEWFRNQVS
jgi:nucleoside-diphosphate-sugar epimerase